jgi:hypothetical protein
VIIYYCKGISECIFVNFNVNIGCRTASLAFENHSCDGQRTDCQVTEFRSFADF